MPTKGDGGNQAGAPATGEVRASARALVKTYSQGTVVALNGLEFTARGGEVTAIIGANGSGKTTLLKALFGLLRPDSGTAEAVGLDPLRQGRKMRHQVGYVPQQHALDPEMTGRETLSFFCTLHAIHGARRRDRVAAMCKQFALNDVADRCVAEYSGGFRQRLHLSIGMIHDPPLVLLDEPTSGLDRQGRADFWESMRSYVADGGAAVIVTHELEDVTRFADRVALLSEGTAKLEATPREAIGQYGHATLEITVDEAPANWEPLRARWQTLDGLHKVDADGQRVTLLLRDSKELDKQVFIVLDDAGLTPSHYRREPPSLESAYFQMTGRKLVIPREPTAGTGRGRRRRS